MPRIAARRAVDGTTRRMIETTPPSDVTWPPATEMTRQRNVTSPPPTATARPNNVTGMPIDATPSPGVATVKPGSARGGAIRPMGPTCWTVSLWPAKRLPPIESGPSRIVGTRQRNAALRAAIARRLLPIGMRGRANELRGWSTGTTSGPIVGHRRWSRRTQRSMT